MGDRARCDTDLHQRVRRRARSRGAADLRQRRVGARSDAGRPRLRQGEGLERRAVHAARRQHQHGRRAVSRMGRAALGAQRQPVGPSHHRAVHRRRSNSVPGNYDAAPGLGRALRTWDFPDRGRSGRPDPRRSAYRRLVSDQQREQRGAAPLCPRCRRTGTTRAPSRRRNRVASHRCRICL